MNLSPRSRLPENANPDFSFALDFSPKREINKVSFASFQPDIEDDIIEDTCDNTDYENNLEDEDEINLRSQDRLINNSNGSWNVHSNKSDNFQNESIPKMQLNMFIQKDAKQSGGKKWPKVETPFCRQNKIAEVDNHNQ